MGEEFGSTELPSLYDRIEESQITLENFRDRFLATVANEETASLLEVSVGSPLLKRLRTSYDGTGRSLNTASVITIRSADYLISYDA